MPLPTDPDAPWPPKHWEGPAAEIAVAACWYEGDPQALGKLYGSDQGARSPSEKVRGGLVTRVRELFWGRPADTGQSVRMHIPAASDVATTSAALLFGEEPTLTVMEAHTERAELPDGTIAPPTPEQAEAIKTENRLAELVELDGISATLINAAEFSSGLGSVYLRPTWDREVADHPMLTIVNADHAVPEYRYGRLQAVTFWTVVYRNHSSEVWRHLERYERGRILHGLYVGTERALGRQVNLRAHPVTEALIGPDGVNDDGELILPKPLENDLAVRDVPNATSRKRVPWGRSDTAGLESEMSALDEAWSSWMRDIRLGKARVVVPDEFLTMTGRGGGARFDVDQEIFSPINMDPSTRDKAGIELIQPEIRHESHRTTTIELFKLIGRSAGYNPQSFGMDGEGGSATATEVRSDEGLSLRTTGRKQRPWQRAVGDVGYQLLVIDREIFKSDVTPMRPQVTFVDPTEADIRERASTLNLINLAQAASVEERVRILHPEWDEPKVKGEADAIRRDYGLDAGALEEPQGVPVP